MDLESGGQSGPGLYRRARAAGFPVKVHTGVVVGHCKLRPVYPGRDGPWAELTSR